MGIKFAIFSLLCFLIVISAMKNEQRANAQAIPIPPPLPPASAPPQSERIQFKNDTSPPKIEVLTTSLLEGGNVFKVRITGESPINIAQITFVQNGQVITESLIRDPNNIYKALIDVHQPSAVVIINAADVQGKKTSLVKYLDVTPLPNSILAQITNFLASIGKSIASIFGPTRQQ
jgi:hypothetical protein